MELVDDRKMELLDDRRMELVDGRRMELVDNRRMELVDVAIQSEGAVRFTLNRVRMSILIVKSGFVKAKSVDPGFLSLYSSCVHVSSV
jgi:hypothetical protein